jgi:hypothetical protein
VQGLSPNTLEARRALYDKARAALLKQLRGADPALTDSQITKERLLLEDAIRRIETDMLRPETATRVLGQDRAKAALPPAGAAAREAEPTRRWQGDDAGDADDVEPGDEEPEAEAYREQAGRFGAAGSETRGFERQRPSAPRRGATSDGRALRYILMAAGVVVLLGGAALAVVMMENREDTAALQPAAPERPALEPTAPAPAPSAGKLTDRLGSEEPKPPEDGAASAPAPAPPQAPPATEPPEQQQAALPPAAAPSAPTAAQPLTPSPGPQATIVAQNAVLYEEQPDNPQRGQAFRGTVTWRTESVSTGSNAPLETAVKGEVDIPERKVKATVTIRKNVDPALPATHTMEIQFQVPADFPNGGISNVPGVLMKQTAQQRGAPLQGLSVKVTNGFFLVGLADSPTDQGRNAQLLKERGWIDVPVLYDNGRRAIMTLEKGIPGDRVFADAFAAWGSAPTAQQ